MRRWRKPPRLLWGVLMACLIVLDTLILLYAWRNSPTYPVDGGGSGEVGG